MTKKREAVKNTILIKRIKKKRKNLELLKATAVSMKRILCVIAENLADLHLLVPKQATDMIRVIEQTILQIMNDGAEEVVVDKEGREDFLAIIKETDSIIKEQDITGKENIVLIKGEVN